MKILVDADGTNRISQVEKIARKFKVHVVLFCDAGRELKFSYSEIVQCDSHHESTDITLFNHCSKGDIVITRDIGFAGIVLAKGAQVLHCSGRIMDNRSIDRELAYRAMKQEIRKNTKHLSQSRKIQFGNERNREYCFGENLVKLIRKSRPAAS